MVRWFVGARLLFALSFALAACGGAASGQDGAPDGTTDRGAPDSGASDAGRDLAIDYASADLTADSGPDLAPACPAGAWCSALYPPAWRPDQPADPQGRFLHDFSYAGYKNGEVALPTVAGPLVDVVQQHGADASGTQDATSAVQAAIDAVALLPAGGVVYFPAGHYRIDGTLHVATSHTVLRGAGATQSALHFSQHQGMSNKAHLTFAGKVQYGAELALAQDASTRSTSVVLTDLGALKVGDAVALGWVITPDFVTEHQMVGVWNPAFIGVWKPIFRRQVVAIDAAQKRVTLDVPLRYPAKLRDQASLRVESGYLSDCGVEQLGLSNAVAWADAWAQNQVAVLELVDVADSWVRDVHSVASPYAGGFDANDKTAYHVQSSGLRIRGSKRVTVIDSSIRKAQNRGGGGNGYLFEVRSSSELLVRDCEARDGRHNFIQNWDFGLSGCVFSGLTSSGSTTVTILLGLPVPWPARCEYHHALAMANLVEDSTLDDGWEGKNRGQESSGAGHTSTGSVFWNIRGAGGIVSKQAGWGYVIGTAPTIAVDTALDIFAGAGTAPEDYVEGKGQGATLFPPSLYQHQLARRLASP